MNKGKNVKKERFIRINWSLSDFQVPCECVQTVQLES